MIRERLDHARLLAYTTRNLRPSQVVHRVRLRAQRWPPSRPIAASIIRTLPLKRHRMVGWPQSFRPLDLRSCEGFPSPEDNASGRFRFLEDTRDLGPAGWDAPGASRLWKYHLHYMEWAWSFACHPDRAWARAAFGELWQSWERSAPFGRGDEWSPYVASLRAWALCGTYDTLVAGSGIQAAVDDSLARHARFLRWHMEHDVGGNHLVKNLRALVGLGVFLGDQGLLRRATAQLQRQISVQVLSDGGHYERSPSYHAQVLGDFIDVEDLLAAAGRPAVPALAGAIADMRTWLGLMLMPDGDIPLFNDCVLVGAERLALLGLGPRATDRLSVLSASGYVVMRPDGRLHLVADVGDPCPPDLPAHAHADCLTFELAVDGDRAVVDSGTSTYELGARRRHERSTAAHNTVSVDGANQTEVWGTFRAARLARGQLERASDDGQTITVVASHDGYRRLPGRPVHRRTWNVARTEVEIVDEVVGTGEHQIESRIHLSPAAAAKVVWTGPPDLHVSQAPVSYATGFGRAVEGHVVVAEWRGPLPVVLRIELHADGAVLQCLDTNIDHGGPLKGTT